ELIERELQDGALARPGITEETEHLLILGPAPEPVPDLANCGGLGGRRGEACHRLSLQHRPAHEQGACHFPPATPQRQTTAVGSAAARGSHSPAFEARTTATARSDISCASRAS